MIASSLCPDIKREYEKYSRFMFHLFSSCALKEHDKTHYPAYRNKKRLSSKQPINPFGVGFEKAFELVSR